MNGNPAAPLFVMPALVAGIHVFAVTKTWMAGTNPAMTSILMETSENG
jgi:hypothetical protein